MIANYLSAALSNLARNRLHSAITTVSLAVGFAAVILATVFVRHEQSYDRFWPDADRLYLVTEWIQQGKSPYPTTSDAAALPAAELIRASAPEVEGVARVASDVFDLEHGQVHANEELYWAEPNLFEVLRPRALEGEIAGALTAPNSIALSRTLAQKYFGDAPALGKTLTLRRAERDDARALKVTAVIEDLGDSHLTGSSFISAALDGGFPLVEREEAWNRADAAYTYVLLRKGAKAASFQASLDAIAKTHFAKTADRLDPSTLHAVPIGKVYLKDPGYPNESQWAHGGVRAGQRQALVLLQVIAFLILGVGVINFITLMTARGARRAVEVGVRKAAGGRRLHLISQFVGESILYAVLAFVLAVALAEVIAPLIRVMTESRMALRYPDDLPLLALLFGGALLTGAVAGLYPAIALSSYRPAAVLKGGPIRTKGSKALRQVLIAAQFLPLITLALIAVSMQVQLVRATHASHRLVTGDPILVSAPCTVAFKAQLEALPEVRSAACMNVQAWQTRDNIRKIIIGRYARGTATSAHGEEVGLDTNQVSAAGLAIHELTLLAGRLPNETDEASGANVLLNESAASALGLGGATSAVGRQVTWKLGREGETKTSTVIGLLANRGGMKDLEKSLYAPTPLPTTGAFGVGVRLRDGVARAQGLAAIDRAWKAAGSAQLLERKFHTDWIAEGAQYDWRAYRFLSACIAAGVLIGALGLFGVAAFIVDQRTKEIGVRKAMGAGKAQIMRLLLLQFAAPVLIAGVIAAPLPPLLFKALQGPRPPGLVSLMPNPNGLEIIAPVLAAALIISLIATFSHAWRVANARPVTALRYE